MIIPANTIIENYKFIRKIGSGGMGEVYEAVDITLERKVAIKILNPSFLKDKNILMRFKKEAKILASLTHKNIVKVYSYFEHNGYYFMVMEYVDGMTLKEKLAVSGLFPENDAKEIILQVLEALKYAHKKNVIHRDIKPSNIMISKSNIVKLMDFGIAKYYDSENSISNDETSTNAQIGTVYYMSPEQVKSSKNVDIRTDIFSLGITYFELLTSNLPYDLKDNNVFNIMTQIVNNPLPNPQNYYPHISQSTIVTLNKMAAKDVIYRFQDCEEVRKSILNERPTEYDDGSGYGETPLPGPPGPNKFIQKLQWLIIIFTAVYLVIILFRNGADKPVIPPVDIIDSIHTGTNKPINFIKFGEEIITPIDKSTIYAALITDDLNGVILGMQSGDLEFYNLQNKTSRNLYSFKSAIVSLCFNENKDDILIGHDVGYIYQFDIGSQKPTKLNSKKHDLIHNITYTKDSDIGFSQKGDFHLLNSNNKIKVFKKNIWSIGINNNYDLIVFGDEDGEIKIYHQDSLNLIKEFNIGKPMYSIEFLDKEHVVIGCEHIISVWNISTEQNLQELKQPGFIKALKYDSTNNILLSYSRNNTIFKWKINKR